MLKHDHLQVAKDIHTTIRIGLPKQLRTLHKYKSSIAVMYRTHLEEKGGRERERETAQFGSRATMVGDRPRYRPLTPSSLKICDKLPIIIPPAAPHHWSGSVVLLITPPEPK